MTRIRIAAVILVLLAALAAGVLLARVFRDSPSGTAVRSKNVPHWLAFHRLMLAQAADYERSHPGVSCETDPPHNVYATQLTCKPPNGREFYLFLLVAEQP
jgi:ABC-type glycerol-3-phosphate transport system substrate-binding protein